MDGREVLEAVGINSYYNIYYFITSLLYYYTTILLYYDMILPPSQVGKDGRKVLEAVGINSVDKEYVPFSSPTFCGGPVEVRIKPHGQRIRHSPPIHTTRAHTTHSPFGSPSRLTPCHNPTFCGGPVEVTNRRVLLQSTSTSPSARQPSAEDQSRRTSPS